MKQDTIPAGAAFAKWQQDPAYAAAYEEPEYEFTLASQIIAKVREFAAKQNRNT